MLLTRSPFWWDQAAYYAYIETKWYKVMGIKPKIMTTLWLLTHKNQNTRGSRRGGGISYLDCIYTVCNKNHEQDDASLYNFLYNLWIISSKPFPAAVILLSLSPVQILNPWHVEHQMVKYSMSVLISYFSTYYWQ